MKKKNVILAVWAVVLMLFGAYIGNNITKDEVYTGTDIEFYTGKTIEIDAPKVMFQAVSGQFFALYNENGDAIAGTPTEKPLGWTSQYFSYGPQEILGGKWLFPVGIASVKITSDPATTVRLIQGSPFLVWLISTFLACVLWLIGYYFVYVVFD